MATSGTYDYNTQEGGLKMKILLMILSIAMLLNAGKYDKVKITPEISYVLVYHNGKSVKVHRIQNIKHRLTGEYAKISRPCPGQCIQPISMGSDINTIGEVEVVKFLKSKVNGNKGLLIDVREKKQYNDETIPSSVNIPYSIHNDSEAMDKIFVALGMKKRVDESWDDAHALDLIFYCNGLWCAKSSSFIREFVDRGYPASRIGYYRGGFQMWKILGFTTVKAKQKGHKDAKK